MRRFPDYDALVDTKLLLPHEAIRLRKVHEKTPYESTWTPLLWATKLLTKARNDGKVKIAPPENTALHKAIGAIDYSNQRILNYGWVNFPMAYVHVANISVYLYFLAALFGRQFLIPHEKDNEWFNDIHMTYSKNKPFNDHTPDMVFPFFTMIEFFCYMGWIKVAQSLLNPFGDDDEDFKINYLIDRNLQVSYLIVDEADKELEMGKDPFLEAGIEIPSDLPYKEEEIKSSNKGVLKSISKPFVGSSSKIDNTSQNQETIKEEESFIPSEEQANPTELAKDVP